MKIRGRWIAVAAMFTLFALAAPLAAQDSNNGGYVRDNGGYANDNGNDPGDNASYAGDPATYPTDNGGAYDNARPDDDANPADNSSYADDPWLDDLVAPVALYPDDVLAILLPATTYPDDLRDAGDFLADAENDPNLQPNPDWDESVRYLLNYPDVIYRINDDPQWLDDMGSAFAEDERAVMEAVQRMRFRAYDDGSLTSDSKQQVIVDGDTIRIVPATADTVYIPDYDTSIFYGPSDDRSYGYYATAYPLYYYPYGSDYRFRHRFYGGRSAWGIDWRGWDIASGIVLDWSGWNRSHRNDFYGWQRDWSHHRHDRDHHRSPYWRNAGTSIRQRPVSANLRPLRHPIQRPANLPPRLARPVRTQSETQRIKHADQSIPHASMPHPERPMRQPQDGQPRPARPMHQPRDDGQPRPDRPMRQPRDDGHPPPDRPMRQPRDDGQPHPDRPMRQPRDDVQPRPDRPMPMPRPQMNQPQHTPALPMQPQPPMPQPRSMPPQRQDQPQRLPPPRPPQPMQQQRLQPPVQSMQNPADTQQPRPHKGNKASDDEDKKK